MKICPECNNMVDSNLSVCSYCGRNLIGVKDYEYDLKVKGQVVDEKLDNQDLSKRIYGDNLGIRSVDDDFLKADFNVDYTTAFKKGLGYFSAFIFVFSLISSLDNYKIILNDQSELLKFSILPLYSVLLFMSLHLNVMIRKKMFIVMFLNISFLSLCILKCDLISLMKKEDVYNFVNYSILFVPVITSFFKNRIIRIVGALSYFYFVLRYFLYIKNLGVNYFDAFLLIKPLFLFLSVLVISIIVFYEIIFFSLSKR